MAMSGAKVNNPGLGSVNQDMVVLTLDSEEADKVLDVIEHLAEHAKGLQFADAFNEFTELLADLSNREPELTDQARLESEQS